MRLASLYSGGKDSSYALWQAIEDDHEISRLVSILPNRRDSWMFHKPKEEILELTSKATDIPLVLQRTEGVKEEELEDLKNVLEKLPIDGIVSGALASTYQRKRLESICEALNLTLLSPLWEKDPERLLESLIDEDFEIIITSVSAGGLGKDWLGRKIDRKNLDKLKNLHEKSGIHIAGEGGEYETLALDAPFFKKRIDLIEKDKIWKGDRGFLKIKKARLTRK